MLSEGNWGGGGRGGHLAFCRERRDELMYKDI